MMSNEQYHAHELDKYRREGIALDSIPRQDKLDNAKDWTDALTDAEWIKAQAEHILAGNFGYAPYFLAREVAPNKRANRAARIGQMIAQSCFNCPANKARDAWRSLDKAQQEAADGAIMEAVNEYLKNTEAE